ncbi:MAG TPA: bifunctional DNA-formamidopyrimidine glycosylase/DNA-(apurinic or apyrimidinic site) lyase [Burkholderiales bacterium]|jgi:formamidopyrimidine-DNA glycosylase|nr:bifunctional DNA-formamidopyrimidine glycosylase/DNA-(apurinic or apyrimidinic site) lyase [Burkholderiales bacterium]
MPELPEVEITRRGIEPFLLKRRIDAVVVRHPQLRWPVTKNLNRILRGRQIRAVSRRGKYLLLDCDGGNLIMHLGMSGSLRVVAKDDPPGTHDHFDLVVGDHAIRLRDPRRFGAVLWCAEDIGAHPLLAHLGVEPLSDAFDADYLYARTRSKKQALKLTLMDHSLVVGVGNIYANESLFRAGIRPQLPAHRLSRPRAAVLVRHVKETLVEALAKGGSSLRDFIHSDGSAGYFQQHYFVYGRDGESCRQCGTPIRRLVQGQRASFYCPKCQRS